MELSVKGKQGEDAQLAIKVTPSQATTVILGEAGKAQLITPQSQFQSIGLIPLKTKLHLIFHKRPWSFTIELPDNISFSTSSEERGLKPVIILRPDMVTITLNYNKNEA